MRSCVCEPYWQWWCTRARAHTHTGAMPVFMMAMVVHIRFITASSTESDKLYGVSSYKYIPVYIFLQRATKEELQARGGAVVCWVIYIVLLCSSLQICSALHCTGSHCIVASLMHSFCVGYAQLLYAHEVGANRACTFNNSITHSPAHSLNQSLNYSTNQPTNHPHATGRPPGRLLRRSYPSASPICVINRTIFHPFTHSLTHSLTHLPN